MNDFKTRYAQLDNVIQVAVDGHDITMLHLPETTKGRPLVLNKHESGAYAIACDLAHPSFHDQRVIDRQVRPFLKYVARAYGNSDEMSFEDLVTIYHAAIEQYGDNKVLN